jgi:hypothetical protein
VSDFLSRVAARAVGRAALARPRLPALFEPAGGGADLEVVEEVVGRSRSAGSQVAGPPSLKPPASPPTGRESSAPRRVRPAEAPARTTVAMQQPSQPAHRDETPLPTLQRHEPGREKIVEERTAVKDATVLVAEAAPATVAAEPAALAKQSELPERLPPRSAPAPPPVRVHIGRLEVRANLQEPPRPQRAPERPQPQELALGDYLRGRRSAS